MGVSNPRDDRAERNRGSTVIPMVGNAHLQQYPISDSYYLRLQSPRNMAPTDIRTYVKGNVTRPDIRITLEFYLKKDALLYYYDGCLALVSHHFTFPNSELRIRHGTHDFTITFTK